MARVLLLVVALVALASVARAEIGCPSNVTAVDLNITNFMGSWFEMATSPTSLDTFEKGCYCTHAIYTLQSNGLVQVNNTCRVGAVNGTVDSIIGTARVPDPSQPGKLQVKFGGPFWAPYWVVLIDPDYQVAVVWSCEVFQFMWILSRTPSIPDAVYSLVVSKAQQITGYDVSKLVRTTQQGCVY